MQRRLVLAVHLLGVPIHVLAQRHQVIEEWLRQGRTNYRWLVWAAVRSGERRPDTLFAQ